MRTADNSTRAVALVIRMQLDFQTIEARLAGQRTAQVFGHQLGVIGMHQLGASSCRSRCSAIVTAGKRGETLVREHDVLAMHGDRFVQAAQQADQRTLALADQQVLHRHLLEQAIGALGELRRPAR